MLPLTNPKETEQYFPDVFCRNCISNELINGGGGGKHWHCLGVRGIFSKLLCKYHILTDFAKCCGFILNLNFKTS